MPKFFAGILSSHFTSATFGVGSTAREAYDNYFAEVDYECNPENIRVFEISKEYETIVVTNFLEVKQPY